MKNILLDVLGTYKNFYGVGIKIVDILTEWARLLHFPLFRKSHTLHSNIHKSFFFQSTIFNEKKLQKKLKSQIYFDSCNFANIFRIAIFQSMYVWLLQ